MSIPQQNKYRQVISVFDGGLSTKNASNYTPVNKSPDLRNVEFTDVGAVQTVKGYKKLNATAIASAPIDGIHEFVDNSFNRNLLAACNGNIYTLAYGSSTFTSITSSVSIFTSGVDVKFVTADNRVFIVNGLVRPYFYTGSNFRQAGPTPISFTTTTSYASLTSSNSGPLSGTYKYALTGLNEWDFETNYTEISSSLLTTSGTISLANIPVFPTSAGIATKYLYRNTAGAATPYFRVTALTAAQTSFADVNADTTLSILAPTDQGVMPNIKYLCEYNGILFGAGVQGSPTVLYYSESGQYEKWPVLNQMYVGRSDGLAISGLYNYGGKLAIHKSDGRGNTAIYYLGVDSTDVTTWVLQKSTAGKGAQSDKTLVDFNSSMAFLNRYGFYSVTGDDLNISPAYSAIGQFGVDSRSYDIEPQIYNINQSFISKAAAIDFNKRIYISVPDGASQVNSVIYTYDYSTLSNKGGSWSINTAPGANNFCLYDGELLAGSSTTGIVYKLEQENIYNFDSSAIDSYYWTALLSGDDTHRYQDKVWRWLLLTVECSGEWNLYIDYRPDSTQASFTTQVSLSQGPISLWGSFVWGVNRWNAGIKKKRIKVPIRGLLSKDIQFKFYTNTVDQWFKIYDIELFYNLRRDR